ncbi:MAG: hypothetical protein AB1801_00100 [Chloroflexota bacterium]
MKTGLLDDPATPSLADLGSTLVLVTGRLYNEVQVKHPRNARFSLQNERGLFFIKVYQAALVNMAQNFEAGAELVVLGELHSFASRRCRNHHLFIKAHEIFLLTGASVGLLVKIEKE